MAGCNSSKMALQEPAAPPAYSIIYIIHGDANYLYHDAEGNALKADEEVLKEAKTVARQAKNGEVFIFHQKPEKKILWLLPKKDRRFLHYRNGTLVRDERYSPQSNNNSFIAEAQFYNRYSKISTQNGSKKVLLYFGHEIPYKGGHGYNFSRSEAFFNLNIFVEGITSFLPNKNARFDLTVLSTCNNGTPSIVHALTPHSRYVLASPQNLHLSHFDTGQLSTLLETSGTTAKQIADRLAEQTYQRLSSFLQTVITLSVYDTDVTGSYLPSLNRSYQGYLSDRTDIQPIRDNIDCATLPFFDTDKYDLGLDVWYKPPRFGQKENAAVYSGWGCNVK